MCNQRQIPKNNLIHVMFLYIFLDKLHRRSCIPVSIK